MKTNKRIATHYVSLLMTAFVACVGYAQTVPELINYQGKLMNGTNLFSGTAPITFRLYDAPTGGAVPHCVDSNDVALAAIQGLHSEFSRLQAENAELKARLERLEAVIAGLSQ